MLRWLRLVVCLLWVVVVEWFVFVAGVAGAYVVRSAADSAHILW